MKKVFIALSTVFLLAAGCNEDQVDAITSELAPATVEFSQNEIHLNENANDSLVTINFSKGAPRAGTILILLTSADQSKVTTTPAAENGVVTLSIESGATKASFKVKPVNNQILDGYKVVSFQIQTTSEGLLIGTKKINTVKITDDEAPVQIAFPEELISTPENSTNGFDITIPFSSTTPAAGTVEFTLSSNLLVYGRDYTFEPAAVNGIISVPFQTGKTNVILKIKPVNDNSFNGDRVIRLRISQATGGAVKGEKSILDIKIADDEAAGFTKGYRTGQTSIGWSSSRFFQYNNDGTIARIVWENYTPGRIGGQYTYEYINGRVSRENEHAGRYSTFTWENGEIIKQETFVNGSLAKYELYGYDQAGNIGEVALYYRQPDGSFKMSFLMVYLYYNDGNLYKQIVYAPAQGSDEYALVETRTYSGYLPNRTHPFPIEIVPNVKAQINLPTAYQLEKEGQILSYQFEYEFNNTGNAVKRTTTGASKEVTTYEYF